MTTETTERKICSVCKEPVKGGFEVFSYSRLGIPQVEIAPTSDRNFNVCDWCNVTTCYRCSDHPESGYCNECYRIASVSIDDGEENKRAEITTTMEQPPKIIYEEPQGSELTAEQRAKLIQKRLKHREVDIADFQGRIQSLCDKLTEIANDFAGYMSDIDSAIMDILVHSKTIAEATVAAEQFDKTN